MHMYTEILLIFFLQNKHSIKATPFYKINAVENISV